ncbi:HlyD family secretion protein [Spiribacter onubensis]|uniref:HlyD family efflux transporter periplasmic adaptor subunit n=1 Tax=Spiribacter onubensis TaxID=3122420 RepID=A0ABV3S8V7_9GAMM
MRVQFTDRGTRRIGSGIPIQYGSARRPTPRLRWFLVILVVSSPLIYLAWMILRGGLMVDASGVLSYETTRAGAMVSGVVREVLVEENDSVAAGQPLIRMENPEIRGRIRHLRQELERMRADKARARDQAQRSLTMARDEIAALETLLDDQTEWLQQVRALSRGGAITGREQYEVAARLQETRRRLMEARERALEAERALQQGDASLRERERQLRLSLDIARTNQTFLDIRADVDGDIVEVEVRPGDTVGPGTTLLTMTRPSVPELTAYLNPADGTFVRAGGRVEVRLPDGTRLPGEVIGRPRLTGRVPPTMRQIIQDAEAALMVRIGLNEAVPEAMAVHGLPVSVEFARGLDVALRRLDLMPAMEGAVTAFAQGQETQ